MALVLAIALGVVVVQSDGSLPPSEQTEVIEQTDGPAIPELVEPPYGVWDALAQCESNGRWNVNSGNGYFGGVQMDMTFWRRHGGLAFAPRPDLASRAQQIQIARVGLAVQGWAAWPWCSRHLGLR